jgi:hypothetical protein
MLLQSMSKKMVWGILAMALLVPAAAQAAGARPDDRAGPRGAEPTRLAPVRPDDRAGIRGVGTNDVNLAVRADERALERGTGPAAPDVVARYMRSHASVTASSSQSSAWFDRSAWLNAAIAAAIALAAASIVFTGLHLIRRPAQAH